MPQPNDDDATARIGPKSWFRRGWPPFESPSRDELRERVEELFPEETRGGRLLRFAQLSKRDAGTFSELVQQHWAAWGGARPNRWYQWWSYTHGSHARGRRAQQRLAKGVPDPVVIHIVILEQPAWATATNLHATLQSLRDQTWPHWRAALIGAAEDVAPSDDRVTILASAHRSPSDALAVLGDSIAERDLVVFIEAGDRLTPDCFFRIAEVAWRNPLIDLVYWDDDLLEVLGISSEPRFRPEWSPEMLLGANYVGRSFAIRARRLAAVGASRGELGDAMWWDLILRANFASDHVERVARVCIHVTRRPCPGPEASLRVIREHLERHGERASLTMRDNTVQIAWELDHWPRVSVIIPTRHNRPMVQRCLTSLARTDYPGLQVVVVDNGARTPDNEAWYRDGFGDLNVTVEWWDQPFNYSAVNNHAVSVAEGEIFVFMNDDAEIVDPSSLRELVSWAQRPELGVVGLQLVDEEGRIQHGGVILGPNGYADHLFQGMQVNSDTIFGPTSWYRNVLAVTGAFLAIDRRLFEQIGGFDERFVLCGGDVALGLDATLAGRRNLCLPSNGVRHFEAATRGTEVPSEDFFASYWRYQRWLFGGDPYFSPNLSLISRHPALRARSEIPVRVLASRPLGRQIGVFRQQTESSIEAKMLAGMFRADDDDVRRVREAHDRTRGAHPPQSVTWFLPDIDSPFYGGVNTALRIADYLARSYGVDNRFVFWADRNDAFFRSALTAAFPALHNAEISFFQELKPEFLDSLPPTDVAIATLWVTAYAVAKFPAANRRFYLIQDFEPCFYPAGTLYALAEESYRFGLYGLCNSQHMLDLYRERYGGRGSAFMPAVDGTVFHAEGRSERSDDDPVTVFVYARPGHFRNCWEMAERALEELKQKLGDQVRIVTAGSWAYSRDLGSGIEHLGLLDYRETGALYRRCDIGVALTVSEHPSYLPLELMACGVPVVAYDNPAGYWILRHEENSILVRRSVDALRDGIERLVLDPGLRAKLSRGALHSIKEGHASWDKAFSGVYSYLSDPTR